MKKLSLLRRKSYLQYFLVLLIATIWSISYAPYGGGSGTVMDPYIIETATHLNNVRENMTSHFRQDADIDLDPEELADEDWYDMELGWLPIGTTGDGGFRGSYDGNGYIISNMRMNRPATDNAGLFGYTAGATLVNVGMIDAHVIARSWIGALVGRLDGGRVSHSFHEGGLVEGHSRVGGFVGLGFNGTEMHYCYSTADAIGEENHVASLVGFFSVGCFMTNCYATGNASGLSRVGGLIGKAYLAMGATVGAVRNSYSTGWVDCPDATLSGGLMGRTVIAGHVHDCFWNTETSGYTTGGQNIPENFGRTTAQMIDIDTYEEWDFDEEDGIWAISEGSYPYLQWQDDTPLGFNYPCPFGLTADADADIVSLEWSNPPVGNPLSYNVYRDGSIIGNVAHPIDEYDDETVNNYITYRYSVTAVYAEDIESAHSNRVDAMPYYFAGGTGTEDDPFLIDEEPQLDGMRFLLDRHFEQIADLDLGEIANWLPIGSNDNPFTGSFDGGGFSIANMTIDRATANYVGLFGYIEETTIKDVNLVNVNINANQYVGGIAGYLTDTTLSGSSVNGTVTGRHTTTYAGGLVGLQNGSPIDGCSFQGIVRGNNRTGGITGQMQNAPSVISNSYSAGEIFAGNDSGGLIGWGTSGDSINNSYSTANITGGSGIGGLIGYQGAFAITNSYSVGAVSGTASVGGLAGRGVAGAEASNSYWNTETSGQDESWRGTPKTTEEMLSQETYEEWDFEDIWAIEEGFTYPYLLWQDEPDGQNIPVPRNLRVTAGDAVVTLNWEAPFVLVPESYNVYRNGVEIGSVDHPTTQYIDDEVDNFITYSYYVTAVYEDDIESGVSNIVSSLPFTFAGGHGSEDNPYQVATDQQLNHIRYILDGHFVQVEDIDLGVEPWTIGDGWVPLGSDAAGNRFTGSYNGNGHVISNLFMDRFRTTNYQGLFGYLEGAELKNIGLENAHVRGDYYVGGLAAYMLNSHIDSCYVTGEVEGSFYTGGLTEYVSSNSTVSNSFCSARVRGGHYTGGFANRNYGTITNCYATGFIYGAGNNIGGFVGNNYASGEVINCYSTGQVWGIDNYGGLMGQNTGTVTNSYWNIETSAQPTSAGGIGKTTDEMISRATFQPEDDPEAHWDFDDIWNIDEEESYPWLRYQGESWEHNYPTLVPPSSLVGVPSNNQVNLYWDAPIIGEPDQYSIYRGGVHQATIPAVLTEWEQAGLENYRSYHYTVTATYDDVESGPSNEVVVVPFPGFAGGRGTEEEPFLIATARQLQDIRVGRHRRHNFLQIADIDLVEYENWLPLGESGVDDRFTGSYDGDGYTISNLTITGDDTYRGLFGYVDGATIENVGLIDVDVSGGNYTAGLGYALNSTIRNCYAIGEITGASYTGGLISYATGTTVIENCYTEGTIASTGGYVGGLVGYSLGTSEIINSYSRADVDSDGQRVGGLIGHSTRPVSNSYALGAVHGDRYVGGLIGWQTGETVNSYAAGRISSETGDDTGGLLGNNTGEVTNSYWDTERSGMDESAGGQGFLTRQMIYPYDFNNVFIEWDFEEVWVADDNFEHGVNPGVNSGYPYLYWQYIRVLDTPIVSIAFNQDHQPVLSWQAVDDANSYRIYASDEVDLPFPDWEMIGRTGETYFIDETEVGHHKFYRVVASAEDAGRGRLGQIPDTPERRTRRNTRVRTIEQ